MDCSGEGKNLELPLIDGSMDSGQSIQLERLAAVAVSACISEFVTWPVDFVKTRMQLVTSPALSGSLSMYTRADVLARVLKERGVGGVYAGVSAGVLRHLPYTSIRVSMYEGMRARRRAQTKEKDLMLFESIVIGFVAGGTAQLVASPFDLVKVRLVGDAGLPKQQRRYKGLVNGFMTIYREQGIKGMWKGSGPAIQRGALVNLGELSTYDVAKQNIVQRSIAGGDTVYGHVLSSLCSGFVSSLISTPADVVKSRMMNQSTQVYASSFDCLRQCWKLEGMRGLYRGYVHFIHLETYIFYHALFHDMEASISLLRWLYLVLQVLTNLGPSWTLATCILGDVRTNETNTRYIYLIKNCKVIMKSAI